MRIFGLTPSSLENEFSKINDRKNKLIDTALTVINGFEAAAAAAALRAQEMRAVLEKYRG